jgi:hypothetical protein
MESLKPRNQVAASAANLSIQAMISAVLCLGSITFAQAQEAQRKNSDESWTVTTETSVDNTNPMRTTESHAKSGGRATDKRTVEVLGPDGRYVPVSDTEKETVRVNGTTSHTVVRIYRWDWNGQRELVQATEEESRTTASGDVHVLRTTSSSDVNGNLEVVERQVSDTKKTRLDSQNTKTTVYRPDGYGGLSTSMQSEELQERGADNRVEVKKTTQLPDGNGGWKVSESTSTVIKEDGENRTTEERVSQPDAYGTLSELSRTVGVETKTTAGERSNTVDTYSLDVPGMARDSNLHLNQRTTTIQKKESDREITEQHVEQPNPTDPYAGMQVVAKTKYTVLYGASGKQQTTTVEARNSYGNFYVVSFETRQSGQTPAAQVPTTPSDIRSQPKSSY